MDKAQDKLNYIKHPEFEDILVNKFNIRIPSKDGYNYFFQNINLDNLWQKTSVYVSIDKYNKEDYVNIFCEYDYNIKSYIINKFDQ
jgi:hypothetical protein